MTEKLYLCTFLWVPLVLRFFYSARERERERSACLRVGFWTERNSLTNVVTVTRWLCFCFGRSMLFIFPPQPVLLCIAIFNRKTRWLYVAFAPFVRVGYCFVIIILISIYALTGVNYHTFFISNPTICWKHACVFLLSGLSFVKDVVSLSCEYLPLSGGWEELFLSL